MEKTRRGINLGGWLVAERWMTPNLFEGVDGYGEIELVRQLGRSEATRRLEKHRDTFIKQTDIAWLAQRGFDTVRVPVGYWLFEKTEDFVPGEVYLKRLFKWATQHKIGVIIDLHGLQGSQNGRDHSGSEGRTRFYKRRNRRDAARTLQSVVQAYGRHPSLVGIQVINEPRWTLFGFRLLGYYRRAYRCIAKNTPSSVKVIVSDNFRPLWMSYLLKWARFGERLVMDAHLYQVFTSADRKKRKADYYHTVTKKWSWVLRKISRRIPVMVGEWSAASRLPRKDDVFERKYYQVQRRVFEESVWAHCYWSYKAPGRGAWDFVEHYDFYES